MGEALFDIPLFKVVAIKNKYLGSVDDVMKTGSPSILINIEAQHGVLPPLVFEVQIYLDAFLSLKHLQHKTYEFKRAGATDLLYPIIHDSHSYHSIIEEVATPRKASHALNSRVED